MHRIDTATATVGYLFTNGNPGLGVPPTIVDDGWLNAAQEEISSVIEGAPSALTLFVNHIVVGPLNAGASTLAAATLVAGGGALTGSYTITCTAVAMGVGTFSVVGPGGALPAATQAVAYAHQVAFTIGGGAPVVGDAFAVVVSALNKADNTQLLAAIKSMFPSYHVDVLEAAMVDASMTWEADWETAVAGAAVWGRCGNVMTQGGGAQFYYPVAANWTHRLSMDFKLLADTNLTFRLLVHDDTVDVSVKNHAGGAITHLGRSATGGGGGGGDFTEGDVTVTPLTAGTYTLYVIVSNLTGGDTGVYLADWFAATVQFLPS